jgi:hypothetical protein
VYSIPRACWWFFSLNFIYWFWVVVDRPEVPTFWWILVSMAVVLALQAEDST